MLEYSLFYAVFLSQILLISAYIPYRIIRRVHFVFENYPASEYPRLYPKSLEYYQKRLRDYRIINQIIMLAGFVLLFAAAFWNYAGENRILNSILVLYAAVQFSPWLLMEIFAFHQCKLMRESGLPATRTADLQPRHLLDFISPVILGIAILFYLAFVIVTLYWGEGAVRDYSRIIGITCINLLFAAMTIWQLYGRKIDPYQAHKDRLRAINMAVKIYVLTSIGVSMFAIMALLSAKLNMLHIMPIIFSVYIQLCALISIVAIIRYYPIDKIDFDAYREQAELKSEV